MSIIMLKSVIVCPFLFAVCSSDLLDLKKPTWTKQIELFQRYSANVAIGSYLYTVSHNTSHIYVNSTDKNYKTCIFSVNSFIEGRLQVAVLGNELKIVVWSVFQLNFYAETVKVLSTMLLVNLKQCGFKKIPLLEDQQSRYLHRMNFDLTGWQPALQVVTYVDTFDVFFGGTDVCSPCRFSDDGEEIELHHRMKSAGNDTYGTAFIQALDASSGSHGYFQVHQLLNHTATIRYLDSHFNVRKQVRIDHHVSKIFVNRGRNPTIAICYLAPPTSQPRSKLGDIYCRKYDSKLKLQASIGIPVTTTYYPIGFSLTLDMFGHLFVTCESSYINSTKLALYHYSKNGQLVESFDLGQLHTLGREFLLERPLFIKREFCFVISKKFHVNRLLKCIIV